MNYIELIKGLPLLIKIFVYFGIVMAIMFIAIAVINVIYEIILRAETPKHVLNKISLYLSNYEKDGYKGLEVRDFKIIMQRIRDMMGEANK